MESNLDTALTTLATEVNELEADRKTGNNSKQVAMGHKLIAIRELLRERNGERTFGILDATGHYPPNGWEQWVKDNLTICLSHTRYCIWHALDPEGMAAKERADSKKRRANKPFEKILVYLRSRLPHCTQEEKERIMNTVYNSYKKADAA
jgi:hypothetical protein